jgi:hypothetical protein
MREAIVTLGGRPYTVRALPIQANAAWRRQLQEFYSSTIGALPDLETATGSDLFGALIGGLGEAALASVDSILVLLRSYAPEIAADWERISAEAYDEEAVAAFVEVIKLAYPFGVLLRLVQTPGATQTTS